ncbi:SDR family NAD(P)-dependent oxidoreductase [Lentzea sp. HUAS12]|uniref:SDR family NAD(P)-dependent oxidoreductase n=1 Tax=Lentzea sp. HUAS12 TaxID=2951806 RepID=UPI00209FE14B|nr:SDR family oxidoreductase [Lentzea sp. HUAS12]USX53463.1 SDR family oxidoreductase [Lentzea sp. HUAS12]
MQIVVITGGSRGLGAAAARACARRGMGVVVTYKANPESAARVVAEIVEGGGEALALPLDVADVSSFSEFREALLVAVREKWGREGIDALVNNAGYGVYTPIESVSEEEFDGLFNVHLKGPFFLTQTLLPLIADRGSVVNMASATSRVATPGVAPYASFKGGLEVLTRYMAKEFGERGIRANAIAPGAIRTELGGGLTPEFEAALAGQTALGRVGEADEVGSVVATLVSEDGRWINAQTVEVAGGYCI